MRVHQWLCAVFLLACWPLPPVMAGHCKLHPPTGQMQHPARLEYRKQLLRFANGFYGALSQDILRGKGEYLLALQRLMGSESEECLYIYRQLLLQETNSQDFALALWTLRVADEANTLPVQDWGSLTVKDN